MSQGMMSGNQGQGMDELMTQFSQISTDILVARVQAEKKMEEKKKSEAPPKMEYPKQLNAKVMPKRNRDDGISMTEEEIKECKHNE